VIDHAASVIAASAAIDVIETTSRGHATSISREAMRGRQYAAVVAFGGDGTVNEVANGLLADGVHPHVPALGVIPAGATNVFARALGLPSEPIESMRRIATLLRAGSFRRISIGRINDRYFLSSAGIGLDAHIIQKAEAMRRQGQHSTLWMYLGIGITTLRDRSVLAPEMLLTRLDTSREHSCHWIVLANANPWTFVGRRPVQLTPEASFDRGLDLYGLQVPSRVRAVLDLINAARRSPRQPARSWTLRIHDVADVEVRVANGHLIPLHTDGDFLGVTAHVRARAIAAGLVVLA
jgi:diacylglycerol kinase family enzyme